VGLPAKDILNSVLQRRKLSQSFESFKGLFLLENPFKQTFRQTFLVQKEFLKPSRIAIGFSAS